MATYGVILNPKAGNGRALEAEPRIARFFLDRGLHCRIKRTGAPRDAARLAATFAYEGCSNILVCGGDGTLHEALNGLPPGSSTTLMTLPFGTVNIFAKTYGIPKNVGRALDLLLHGRTVEILPGSCNGTRFLLMLSAGIDSHVVHNVTQTQKRWGRLAYAWEFSKSLLSYPYPTIKLRVGNEVHTGRFALVSKCRLYAGFLPITPLGHPESDAFQVCLLIKPGFRPLMRLLVSVLRGRTSANPDCLTLRADHLILEGEGLTSQVDGEPFRSLPLDIRIETRPVYFQVPATGYSMT